MSILFKSSECCRKKDVGISMTYRWHIFVVGSVYHSPYSLTYTWGADCHSLDRSFSGFFSCYPQSSRLYDLE